jgi:hypothetical protein
MTSLVQRIRSIVGFAFFVAVATLFCSAQLLAAEKSPSTPTKKDLYAQIPIIELRPTIAVVKNGMKKEQRYFVLQMQLFEMKQLQPACAKVIRFRDQMMTSLQSEPAKLNTKGDLDIPPLEKRFMPVAKKVFGENVVKTLQIFEGYSLGDGSVADRLPNNCK